MAGLKPFVVLAFAAAVGLSACSNKVGGMMNLRASGAGPDAFAVLPTKPLVMPANYTSLPVPTPGGENLTDPTPRANAVVALGGNPKYLKSGTIPSADRALIAAVSRYGVAKNIRSTLARADLEFRKKHRGKLLERLFGNTVYFSAYKPMTLNRYAELKVLRKAGIRTPAAPPDTAKK